MIGLSAGGGIGCVENRRRRAPRGGPYPVCEACHVQAEAPDVGKLLQRDDLKLAAGLIGPGVVLLAGAAYLVSVVWAGIGQQIVLPLGEFDAPLDSGHLGAAAASGSTDEPGATNNALSNQPAVRPRKLPWASLVKRSLGVSGLVCPNCQAQMVLLALISQS
jgi:hypothetical protein